MDVEHFLTYDERQQVAEAIRLSEMKTSGEIRVHIATKTHDSPENDALAVFHLLDMQYTAKNNAVLLFITLDTHKIVVLGDKGIHQIVGDVFWKSIITQTTALFMEKKYLLGITRAVQLIGEKLAIYFPPIANDKNELSNEVTFS